MFLIKLFLFTIFLVLSGFFSGSETAFFSLNKIKLNRMKHSKKKTERLVAQLMKSPAKLLTTILMGNMFVNIASSSLSSDLMERILPGSSTGLTVVLMTFLLLIFGEITPKTFAVKNAERISLNVSRIFITLEKLLAPFRFLVQSFANFIITKILRQKLFTSTILTHSELKTALNVGFEEGVVDDFEKKVIENVFKFGNRTIRQVFTPKIQTKMLDITTSYSQMMQFLKEAGYSRIPVYEGDEDNIVGILHVRDIVLNTDTSKTIKDFLRPVIFIPETRKVNSLLIEFQRSQTNFAVVIDEYGVFSGIITMDDLLEEIVGEIADAKQHTSTNLKIVSPNEVIFDATMELDDFNEQFGTDFEDSTVQSIGGYILNRLGRIPKQNESFRLGGFIIKVVEAKPNKIEKLIIQKESKK